MKILELEITAIGCCTDTGVCKLIALRVLEQKQNIPETKHIKYGLSPDIAIDRIAIRGINNFHDNEVSVIRNRPISDYLEFFHELNGKAYAKLNKRIRTQCSIKNGNTRILTAYAE